MLSRTLLSHAAARCRGHAAAVLTGPRQAGKSTLARLLRPDLPLINLENPVERERFRDDPEGCLAAHADGAIFDEAQHVPALFSHLQVHIDRSGRHDCRFLLTGSQQLALNQQIGQSLAGRVAQLELLPFALVEMADSPRRPQQLAQAVLQGGYPPLYDTARLAPDTWLDDYLATFINRDIFSLTEIRNRPAFDRFLRLVAARSGQLFNQSQLGRDAGIDQKTAAAWMTLLEACYVVRLLRPYHRTFGQRMIKAPKVYLLDTGLACRLLRITDEAQLLAHPQWGALVETWCVSEALKARLHRGQPADLWYWRNADGHEVDLLLETANDLHPIEIKASTQIHERDSAGIRRLRKILDQQGSSAPRVRSGTIIHNSSSSSSNGDEQWTPWHSIDDLMHTLATRR